MTKLFYSMDHVLLLADYDNPKKHKHFSKHILISLDEDIHCLIEDKEIICRGIIIDSNVFHTIKSNKNNILVYLFDETTYISKELKEKYLKNDIYHVITLNTVENITKIWNENMVYKEHTRELKSIYLATYKEILKSCSLNTTTPYVKDKRIIEVLDLIKHSDGIQEGIIDELASKVFLSQSRLSHLFKDETKIALSSWLVIMKISKTYEYILKGQSITEAAIKAGFYSSSHFATTNKEMFGISASNFRKDVEVIEL